MIIVSALSLRDQDRDREKEKERARKRERETELDNFRSTVVLLSDFLINESIN